MKLILAICIAVVFFGTVGCSVAHEYWYEEGGEGYHYCTCTASIPAKCHCVDAPNLMPPDNDLYVVNPTEDEK